MSSTESGKDVSELTVSLLKSNVEKLAECKFKAREKEIEAKKKDIQALILKLFEYFEK